MILRPISAADSAHHTIASASAWNVIERVQQECAKQDDFWMVPQPAHAALSGDIAARLSDEAFPHLTNDVIRCIALHDAGWGTLDAAAIQDSRGGRKKPPPFIGVPAAQFTAAWTASIETAQKVCDVGAYMVSAHFLRISELHSANDKAVQAFQKQEEARQRRLRCDIAHTAAELERLVDALQFCDVLSLYLCCGAEPAPGETVEYPQQIGGRKITMHKREGEFVCEPSPFRGEHFFEYSAMRHPRSREDAPSTSFSQAVR